LDEDDRWFLATDLAFGYQIKQIYKMIVPTRTAVENLGEVCMNTFDEAANGWAIPEGAIMVYLCEDFHDTIEKTGKCKFISASSIMKL
jgi:hypothetical protein